MSTVSLPGAECGDCLDCMSCHARTVIRWRGNRDFTNDRDIRNFPRYHHALLDWQEGPTSLLWRLRFDLENRHFFDEMRDLPQTLTGNVLTADLPSILEETEEFVTEPPSWWRYDGPPPGLAYYGVRKIARVRRLTNSLGTTNENVQSLGPVIGGVLDDVYASTFRGALWSGLPWNWIVPGAPTSPQPSGTLGGIFGFNFTWAAIGTGLIVSPYFPTYAFVDVPLAIDIGCVRQTRSQTLITWPVERLCRMEYVTWYDYTDRSAMNPTARQLDVIYGHWYRSTVPAEFTITHDGVAITVAGPEHGHEIVPHECETMDADELEAYDLTLETAP